MIDSFDINSVILQPRFVDVSAALVQLQCNIAELAIHQEKLAELQKQQVRETLKEEFAQGIKQLNFLSDTINALATQLENEMLNFKRIAVETNRAYYTIQQPPDLKAVGMKPPISHRWRPVSIWQVHYSAIPIVVKQRAVFVLTTKIVDLFQAERERDVQRRVEVAQRRRKAFEHWLLERRRS